MYSHQLSQILEEEERQSSRNSIDKDQEDIKKAEVDKNAIEVESVLTNIKEISFEEDIKMDISTVSRVVNGKSVATDFGVFPLKYFFSEPIATTEGKEVSSRTIKSALKKVIEKEDKQQPYTDEELVLHMKNKGYILARRTVAKYRSQLGLPVARMRKEL